MTADGEIRALSDRVDRFETRVERELASGARSFMRREVFDRFEREIHSDIGDIRRDLGAMAQSIEDHNKAHARIAETQDNDRKGTRKLILIALMSSVFSGAVSIFVALAVRPPA